MSIMKSIEEWVPQNPEIIEKAVEILGLSCKVLADTVGELNPILKLVFVSAAMLCNIQKDREAEQLAIQKVKEILAAILHEGNLIALELQRIARNMQNIDYEVRIISQYEEFVEFVNAEPTSKDKKKEAFLSHFESTKRDHNLDALYDAVTGEPISGENMLDQVVNTEKGSRKAVKEFCDGLQWLFIMGIIPVMGHTLLKKGSVSKDLVKKWQDRLELVEKRMKVPVNACTKNFAIWAKDDIKLKLQEKQGSIDQTFTESLLEFLKDKYDWVSWSLLVVKNKTGFHLPVWPCEKYHGHCGEGNFFQLTEKKNEVVVSFSADSQPFNTSEVATKTKGSNMEAVAKALSDVLPNCVVHAISRNKDVLRADNFPKMHYYFCGHESAYVCIHSK